MSGSNPARVAAIIFGTLAVLAIPSAVALAVFMPSVTILWALAIGVAGAFVLALCGISASRRARFRVERSVYRRGDGTVRFGRLLVWSGLYLSLVGALALAFYGVLRASG
jgi:hypothetical protein